VEGWDQPAVEITVTKSLRFGGSKTPDQDLPRLESIRVVTNRTSPTELTISTSLVPRHGKWPPPVPKTTTNGVQADYEIHVPRASRLAIHHGTGLVSVRGVTGDIQASAGRGDILLWLAPGSYSIDARTKLGNVASDFEGASLSQYLTGQRFTRVDAPPSRRLYLRMGFGGITIKQIYPESEVPAAASGK
jgi:hypothetical protein